MVVGNDFVLIFVLLNQTNYDKHIQNIQWRFFLKV